jgi:uncharacterized protein
MDIQEDKSTGSIQIAKVNSESANINGKIWTQSFFVSQSLGPRPWNTVDAQTISLQDLKNLPIIDYELLLLGTGVSHKPLDMITTQFLLDIGIAYEVMATMPACRTFNIVSSESRKTLLAVLF